MKIHLPPGTTSIDIYVNEGRELPSIDWSAPYRPSAPVQHAPGITLPKASTPAVFRPRHLLLLSAAGFALLVGGFTIGAVRTAPPARAALPQQTALGLPIPQSKVMAGTYEATPQMANSDQPQVAAHRLSSADDVLQQLATRPTVTPPPVANVDAPASKNPFGLE